MRPLRIAFITVLIAVSGAGCAQILPIVGSVALMGIDYTSKNCPRKTFTCGVGCVHEGVLEAMDAMSMKVTTDEPTPQGYKVKAEAKGLAVTIEMVRLTETTTKIGVDAAKYLILRDGATAEEIVVQVEEALERRGALSAGGYPKAPPAAAGGRTPGAS